MSVGLVHAFEKFESVFTLSWVFIVYLRQIPLSTKDNFIRRQARFTRGVMDEPDYPWQCTNPINSLVIVDFAQNFQQLLARSFRSTVRLVVIRLVKMWDIPKLAQMFLHHALANRAP